MNGVLALLVVLVVVGVVVGVGVVLPSLRICTEWERKVVLRLGKFAGVRGPGVFLLLPYVETTPYTIDIRTITDTFAAEQTLTHDSVPVDIDATVFWRVTDAGLAITQVADYRTAVQGAAQAALRDAIGQSELATILANRVGLDAKMTAALAQQVGAWGIRVEAVQMRDIRIPASLQEAMSRVAQADRERQARLVLGDSEVQVAQRFATAGALYEHNPLALHLRGMNMLYEVMRAGNAATIIIPSSAVDSMGFGGVSGMASLARDAHAPLPEGAAPPPSPVPFAPVTPVTPVTPDVFAPAAPSVAWPAPGGAGRG